MSKIWGKGKGIPPGRSKCVKCGKSRNNKTSYRFYKSRYDSKGYRARNNSTCIQCETKQRKILYELHKKHGHLKPADGTPCPLCNRLVESKDGVSNKWCLDHNHETKEYRGWICHKCNNAIGRLNEDAETALNIYKYLLEKK
jgi:hypothetical protein